MSVACPRLTPAALAFPAAGASTAHTHKLNYSVQSFDWWERLDAFNKIKASNQGCWAFGGND